MLKKLDLPELTFVYRGKRQVQDDDIPEDFDPDDEDFGVTPPDVVEMLGFDPRKFDDEGDPIESEAPDAEKKT